jgi:hypothetical protein
MPTCARWIFGPSLCHPCAPRFNGGTAAHNILRKPVMCCWNADGILTGLWHLFSSREWEDWNDGCQAMVFIQFKKLIELNSLKLCILNCALNRWKHWHVKVLTLFIDSGKHSLPHQWSTVYFTKFKGHKYHIEGKHKLNKQNRWDVTYMFNFIKRVSWKREQECRVRAVKRAKCQNLHIEDRSNWI